LKRGVEPSGFLARGYEDGMFDLRGALFEAAQEHPVSPFLQHKNACIPFAEGSPALARIALQLPSLSGLRVVILLADGLSAALLHLECFSQGATIVPLSPFSPASYVQYALDRVQPDLVLTTPLLHAKFSSLLNRTSVAVVGPGNPMSFEILGKIPLRDLERPRSPVRAIFFTSGTTGEPKGVCLSENNLLSAAWINRTILGLDSSRRSLITVPLYDYYGCIQLYSHAMAKASCTIGESGQFPRSAFTVIDSQAITDIVLVPFTLKALLDYAQNSECDEARETFGKVAYVASSSDHLSPDLLKSAFLLNPGLTVVNVYGLTEAGRASYRLIVDGASFTTSIGIASPSMTVRVDALPGKTGEILISGPTVMLGYLQRIADEEIHFMPVTEVRTADEGFVDSGGEIHLLGRKDHLMSLHGMKLHPSEIEVLVNQVPGVKDSFAHLHQDARGNKAVVLDLVADQSSVTQNQILNLLRERVPRVFLPQVINFVEAISRTEIGGKLIRPRH